VPEISPMSISAGLALLAGGVLMLRARRRSK
jgi:LPXTG-motif cell wall-anchored protein